MQRDQGALRQRSILSSTGLVPPPATLPPPPATSSSSASVSVCPDSGSIGSAASERGMSCSLQARPVVAIQSSFFIGALLQRHARHRLRAALLRRQRPASTNGHHSLTPNFGLFRTLRGIRSKRTSDCSGGSGHHLRGKMNEFYPLPGCRIGEVTSLDLAHLSVAADRKFASSRCPDCGHSSDAVHS